MRTTSTCVDFEVPRMMDMIRLDLRFRHVCRMARATPTTVCSELHLSDCMHRKLSYGRAGAQEMLRQRR